MLDTASLPPLAECEDQAALVRARNVLSLAHAALAGLSPRLKSWAAVERIDDLTAMLEEEIAGLASVAERCAEQEEIDRCDWRLSAWGAYHDANRG